MPGPRSQARFGTYEADELARIVFSDADALADLERILHPRVRGAVRARLAELDEGGAAAASVEAIKLLESPLADACDQVWVVRCEEGDAIRRLARVARHERGGGTKAAGQPVAQDEKVAAADVVIDGSAPIEETRRQVEQALAALLSA